MYNNHQIRIGIIKAICYADIFDYPLKREEIGRYMVDVRIDTGNIAFELNDLVSGGMISYQDGLYYLNGREKIIALRKERQVISRKKFKIAQKAALYLSRIPTIKFIGVSGSLSVANSKSEDDIDLFFITSKDALWITRFVVNITLILKGNKRSKKSVFGTDKICPNMFMSEDMLTIRHDKQNLFTAHEMVQLVPLVNKENAYERFLNENSWVTDFLPNLNIPSGKKKLITKKNIFVGFLNEVFYLAQYIFMMRIISDEEVGLKIARFHPRDVNSYVLSMYKIRLNEYMSREISTRDLSGKFDEDTPGY